MKEIIFDAEFDGLNPTKIHCLSFEISGKVYTTSSYKFMKELITNPENYLVGHNIIMFDIPALEKILQVKCKAKLVDTLAISWYLHPFKTKHGLEEWGEDLGIEKPKVEDWENESLDTYIHRCETDVKINSTLWSKFKKHLFKIYESSEKAQSLLDYLTFKLTTAAKAEQYGWRIDKEKAHENLKELYSFKLDKEENLRRRMPQVPNYSIRRRPKVKHKQDGSPSSRWINWLKLLKELGEPLNTEEVKVVSSFSPPNPSSPEQIKQWLFSLGWEPCTNKVNTKGEEVPQIKVPGSPELTESVLGLSDKEPAILELEGLFTINHRIGILEGFLEEAGNGDIIKAKINGLTNTLRFKHKKPLVNLPGVDKPYGKYIRPCLIAREGKVLCGADMASLEDRTKQHYIWEYDPEYVKEMMRDGYDPHLDVAKAGGIVTDKDIQDYKDLDAKENKTPEEEANYKRLKGIRTSAKVTNYACTYKAYPLKIASIAKIPLKDAEKLWKAYWDRNNALTKIANAAVVKELDNGEQWLYNPVNGYYYSLRKKKDIFSTLNQGTGSFCFDVWLGCVIEEYNQITAQFHDEGVWEIDKGEEEKLKEVLTKAIKRANIYLQLNRELDINIQFGQNYGEIH